jgi:hypothetical protein
VRAVLAAVLAAFLVPTLAGRLGTLCISPRHLGFETGGACCCETRHAMALAGAAEPPASAPAQRVHAPRCDDPCCAGGGDGPCIDLPAADDPIATPDHRVERLPAPVLVAVIADDPVAALRAVRFVQPVALPPPRPAVAPPPRAFVLRC